MQLHGCSVVDIVLVVHMQTSIVETVNLENQSNVSCDIISQAFVNISLWDRLNSVQDHLEYKRMISYWMKSMPIIETKIGDFAS